MIYLFPLLALPFAVFRFCAAFVDTIDLTSAPNFSALRTCGHCCLCVGTNCSASQCIATSAGCDTDTCLCSSPGYSLATSYLESCVQTLCTPEDVPTYGQVFSSYCQDVKKNAATTSSTSTTSHSTVTATTSPASPTNPTGDPNYTLQLGLGLGLGIPGFIVALFFGYTTIKHHYKSKYKKDIGKRDAADAERWHAFQDRVLGRAPAGEQVPLRALLGV